MLIDTQVIIMKKRSADENSESTNISGTNPNTEEEEQQNSSKKVKLVDTSLDLCNLGAGYDPKDKRVIRAIEAYETKLLPYIKENQSIFKHSNFLTIKGYGTDIPTN